MITLLSTAQPTRAEPKAVRLDLPAQTLGAELAQLAQVSGIELLFDGSTMARRRGVALHGVLTPEQALTLLLKGSGFEVHRTAEGVFVIGQVKPTASKPRERSAVGAVAEILVIGRRSLNVDIPRSENDVQPYEVATSEDIARSQAESVEDFLRTSLPDDTASPAAIQEPGIALGSPASQVNLRGLGLEQTLLLLDGRRLPSTSVQPDLNGLPLEAIDRVETLTSTAGGIYGPDATAGVINLVQKRDYQGGELSVTSGETTRGDAPQWRVDGAFGGASALTGTKVMLAFSHAEDAGLTFGDRKFVQSAATLAAERSPGSLPVAGQVNVESLDGTSLMLIPALGGQSLGSNITHLPLSVALAGSPNEASLLLQNAGAYDGSLSPDGRGEEQSLLTATRTNAVLFSARQPIVPRLEAFIDLVYLTDSGTAKTAALDPLGFLPAGQAGNPFQNDVEVAFPTPGLVATETSKTTTERATVGFIAGLGHGWTSDADFVIGRAVTKQTYVNAFNLLYTTPFSGNPTYATELSAFQPAYSNRRLSDQLSDFSLRLAGPVARLPGGPLTMTLLAETRDEHPPVQRSNSIDYLFESTSQQLAADQVLTRQRVSSIYAEARVPLVSNPQAAILRGFDLQLAIREDWSSLRAGQSDVSDRTTVINDEAITSMEVDSVVTNTTATTATTAGAKITLAGGIALRSSIATGYLPNTPFPSFSEDTYSPTPSGPLFLVDPQRGGQSVGTKAPFMLINREYPHPVPELARTASIGAVVTPVRIPGLRISADYTRTELSHGITDAGTNLAQYLIDHESTYSNRIVRAPLTSADVSHGYTAGVLTSLDYSELSDARYTVDSVHLELSYTRQTALGAFRFFGQATWEPDYRVRDDPTQPTYETAGYSDGPLKLRGTLSLDWIRGRWTGALSTQFYSGYQIAVASSADQIENVSALELQGATKVPSQAYIDALVAYRSNLRRPAGGPLAIEYKFGIRNLFDWAPPVVVGGPLSFENLGYSTYGDPRGRRFEFTATARF